jgi:hypothetical protein
MPSDTTPDPRDMQRMPEEQQIPQPLAGRQSETVSQADIRNRPALPDRPVTMPADVEDEDADPVVESGPLGESDSELNRG